ADSRPAPGPLTSTFTVRNPDSLALLAAVSEACCAANGVPLRDPRNPSEPELDHDSTFPMGSVMVMMVLLKDACTWTTPTGTIFFSFFLKVFFLPPLAAVFAGALVAMCNFQLSLGLRAGFFLVSHGAAPRTLAGARVGVGALSPHRQAAAMPHSAIRTHLDQALDVHRDLFAQIAFHRTFGLENGSNMIDFVFRQLRDFLVGIHARPVAQRLAACPPDAVDVGETDLGPLL